jgi:hypothetical protein
MIGIANPADQPVVRADPDEEFERELMSDWVG